MIANSCNFSPTLIFHEIISLVSCYTTITPVSSNFQWTVDMIKNNNDTRKRVDYMSCDKLKTEMPETVEMEL
jgi:hypothetical protein